MSKLIEIKFDGINELIELAETRAELLKENVTAAVAETTLFGINKIANDCPVDTGRLRASIAGEFASLAGVDLKRGKIGEGKGQSVTKIDFRHMEGRIGTNVEYALPVEYGHKTGGPNRRKVKLTKKQLRYLFAIGALKEVNGMVVPWKRSRTAFIARMVPGKGMFRNNIPIIETHFKNKMNEAITATREGRSLGQSDGD
jgi:hypothetical protein